MGGVIFLDIFEILQLTKKGCFFAFFWLNLHSKSMKTIIKYEKKKLLDNCNCGITIFCVMW